ncbi:hypothetical protein [Pseudomonas sp. SBB6]|uniref:hypothetical protein n=1 Tax=Pseudomonas sp. SBB6 TaxID=2962032 RepID=UPI0020B817D3|nr:hypothetical protein [Pseudomonas sp. SBB6]MCP3751467.1 hypothetical protein [Pseudomonas sp. SBB6]
MNEKQFEFHLEEFRQLKAEISALLARIGFLFRNSIIASSVLYAWLLSKVGAFSGSNDCIAFPKDMAAFAIWIPPAFVAASFSFGILTYLHVVAVGKYLRKCECELGADGLGWEKFWSGQRPYLTIGLALIWILLLASSVYVSYQTRQKLEPLPNCPNPKISLELPELSRAGAVVDGRYIQLPVAVPHIKDPLAKEE